MNDAQFRCFGGGLVAFLSATHIYWSSTIDELCTLYDLCLQGVIYFDRNRNGIMDGSDNGVYSPMVVLYVCGLPTSSRWCFFPRGIEHDRTAHRAADLPFKQPLPLRV